MGVVLDTSVLIAGERNRQTGTEMLAELVSRYDDPELALSAISVVEFTHGIYRAKVASDRRRRGPLAREIYADVLVVPVSFEIALLAGQIEGEQAALGNVLPFEDLLVGATALHLNFGVVTSNLRHFSRIPDALVRAPLEQALGAADVAG